MLNFRLKSEFLPKCCTRKHKNPQIRQEIFYHRKRLVQLETITITLIPTEAKSCILFSLLRALPFYGFEFIKSGCGKCEFMYAKQQTP